MYGATRFFQELRDLGFAVCDVTASNGERFAVIPLFTVPGGRFTDRVIGLGLPVTADFPKTVGSCIHVRSDPHLYDTCDSKENVRNIQASVLGPEWRYWSHNFGWQRERSARYLMSQINGVFLYAS